MGRGGQGPAAMMRGGQKAKNFRGTMRNLLRYMRPYRLAVIAVFIFAIASTAFNIAGPKILGNATTKLFEGIVGKVMHVPGAFVDYSYIGRIALILLTLYFISALCSYIQGWLMTGVAMKVTYRFRQDISRKIDRLPLRYFDTRTYGEVLSRVTNDVDTVGQTLNQSLTQIITSVTMILGVLVMMLSISWLMTLVALVIIPLALMLVAVVVKASQRYFKQQQEYLGHVNGHVEEMYGGHSVVRAYNGEEQSAQKFTGLNKVLYGAAWKSQFLSGLMIPIMTFIGNLGFVGVSIVGGYLVVRGSIQVGDIQAFIQYVRSFNQPLVQSAQIANVLQSTAAAAERVFEFLNEEEETPENAAPVALDAVNGSVEFKDINFGYAPDKQVIKDFSACVRPGQKVAIVGTTGAGKTTIIKLLMRFYDVQSGSITVDGVDIRNMQRGELRRLFGMVLQDTWLFNGTIRDNIRYGQPDASDEQVVQAAKIAFVDHFVRTLPQGYDMVINEEANNISQGEKQLLTIARAFLTNPKILILDEATSSVDTRTEVFIQQAMEKLMTGRTSFIIAHRLSTIRNADIILVMQDGAIVEQGNHERLLGAGGLYASLYNSQFESAPAA
ncbi:MAG: ABC transporter ATP-binding protein/permease [Dehalococcoidia bacterium]|nr:ABC transporter ATP-binding protein/permease [Dehalococcoidia bacterium]